MFEEAVRVAGPEGDIVEADGGWQLLGPDGARRGWAGALAADRPPWGAPLCGFEVDVVVRDRPHAQYDAVPTTPPVERDVALVLPDGVTATAVEDMMREEGGALLAGTAIFDEYRGEEVDGRSVAWRLVFRAPDRTLRDREVDEALEAVLATLKERLGVERR